MIKQITNLIFYGKRYKKQQINEEKREEERHSIGNSILSFFEVFIVTLSYVILYSIRFLIINITDLKNGYKNATINNLTIAKKFLKNGDIFDGILRLRLILLLDKNNFHALLMLGYFYYERKWYKKSLKYFTKIHKNLGEKSTPEINFMLNELQSLIASDKKQ